MLPWLYSRQWARAGQGDGLGMMIGMYLISWDWQGWCLGAGGAKAFFWFVMVCLLHSPFLALFSFVWLSIQGLYCRAEGQRIMSGLGEARAAKQRT